MNWKIVQIISTWLHFKIYIKVITIYFDLWLSHCKFFFVICSNIYLSDGQFYFNLSMKKIFWIFEKQSPRAEIPSHIQHDWWDHQWCNKLELDSKKDRFKLRVCFFITYGPWVSISEVEIFQRRPTIRDFGRLYVTYVTEDKAFKDEPRSLKSESINAITKF